MFSNGKWLRASFFWLLILLIIVLATVLFFHPAADAAQVNVSTILSHVREDMSKNQRDTLTVSGETLTLTRGTKSNASQEIATINDSFDITRVLADNNINYANNNLLVLQYQA